jgi:hypothetical protein
MQFEQDIPECFEPYEGSSLMAEFQKLGMFDFKS